MALGQLEDALNMLTSLRPVFTASNKPGLSVLTTLQAKCLLESGRTEDTLQNIDQALDELSSYPDDETLWRALYVKAQALVEMGHRTAALDCYLDAAEAVNRLRGAPRGYRLDTTYINNKIPMMEQAIKLAAELHDGPACCRPIEVIKARSLAVILCSGCPG